MYYKNVNILNLNLRLLNNTFFYLIECSLYYVYYTSQRIIVILVF